MPLRTGHTYVIPGKGVVNTKKKTFTGKGAPASGSKKTPEKSYTEVPTVTSSHGKVLSTSGFSSPAAARRAVRRAQAGRQRVRRIEHAVNLSRQKPSYPISKPVGSKAATRPVADYKPPPTAKPKTFQGRKTAGAPTLKALETAAQTGTLKVNRAGFATTPEVRRAAKRLKVARKAVKRTTGITGPLTQGQKTFARQLAKETPLRPRVIGAQELAEESGPAAKQRDAERNFNYLNIGYFDSGPGALTAGREWSSPKAAAHATAEFLKGKKYGASPSIQAILPTAKGKSDAAQIAAIGNSDWATSGAYRESIEGTHDLIGMKRNPKAVEQLQAAKAQAQKLGLKVAPQKVGPPPKKLVTRYKAAKQAMREVEGLPYVWGGGHGSPTSSPTGGGLDCSGAVGYVLNKIGALKGSLTSGDMGSVLKPGPGALTVFYNGEHTFLRLGNEYWGTSVGDSGAGGLGPHAAPSASYLAQYNVGHVPGMGMKQALELGFKNLSTPTSFPGMTLSPSGTTATVDSGSAVTQEKPGFSARPIKLTRAEKAQRTFKALEAVGIGGEESEAPKRVKPAGVSIADLERKYGRAA